MRRFAPYLLILLIVAAVLRVSFYFTILYLFLALALMSHLWIRRRAERVCVQRRFLNRAFFGDSVAVDLLVHNTSRLPVPWLELHESLPVDLFTPPLKGQVISLGPREHWRMRYTLNCRKRGYYSVGPLTMTTGDLLGIERSRTRPVASNSLVVYPQVVPIHQLGLPTRSPLMVLPAQSPLFEDPARVTGVRDYQRGDSPRRIHWTATASAGRLLVKQFQPAIARETLIFLDLNPESYIAQQQYTATELAIVVAASVANHIIVREQLAVGLVTEAQDALLNDRVRFLLPPRSERAHLMGLLEVLARAQVTRGSSLVGLLRRESVQLAWGATLLVIAGSESAELLNTLAHLRRAGFAVALILVRPGRSSSDLRQRGDLLGLPIYRVWRTQDLEMRG